MKKPTKTPDRKLLANIAYQVSGLTDLTNAEIKIAEMLLEIGYLSYDKEKLEYKITDLAKYFLN